MFLIKKNYNGIYKDVIWGSQRIELATTRKILELHKYYFVTLEIQYNYVFLYQE